MYEIFILLIFASILLLEKFKIITAFLFGTIVIIFFLYEITAIDLITYQVSVLLSILLLTLLYIMDTYDR